MDELIGMFSLEKCSKSGAKFDYEKGKWFNHQYIQLRPDSEIANIYYPILEEKGIDCEIGYVEKVVNLVKERVNFIKELWDQSYFFFGAPASYDEKVVKKRWKDESPVQLAELTEVLNGIDDFSAHNQEEIIKAWIESKGYHLGNIMNAFRLAIVGESKGPHMFDITLLSGKRKLSPV